MSRIYWDTMLFMYWMEDHPQFSNRIEQIHARMRERNDQLLTSAFTFGEILTGVHRIGAAQRAEDVRRRLQSIVAEVIPFTMETANHYAKIRAAGSVSPADTIHLASAAQAHTDLFLTNDKRLIGKFVPGIHFIASLDDHVL